MNSQAEQVFAAIQEKQKDLNRDLYDLLNSYMSEDICRRDPDFAMGAFLAAFITAMSEYTASYRILNQLEDSWSTACVHGVAQGFANSHYGHFNILSQQTQTEIGEIPEVN